MRMQEYDIYKSQNNLLLCHKEEGGDGGQCSERSHVPCDPHTAIAHCLRHTLVTPDYIIMNRYLLEVNTIIDGVLNTYSAVEQ